MSERIGILGGSFNPVHTGHLLMAQDAFERFSLGRVLFIPANQPPHKRTAAMTSAEHRLAMLELALQGDARFEVCDEEIRRGGVSYSVDTLRALKTRYPGAQFYFIVGGDTLPELHTWKDIHELAGLCDFITIARPGLDPAQWTAASLRMPQQESAKLIKNVIVGHLFDVSSTDIRQRAARGLSLRYLVPAAVEEYIASRNLYR